ncbi:MAG: hypothetical protein LAO24_15430 [Acidobacteriia bacterium]|nr:hypothetical protein [Terriglobia bacterium]
MSRNSVLVLSFVFLTLLGAMTISCGGSYGSGGGNTGPYNVVGNWQATFSANVGATTVGYGAIDSSGLGAVFDTSGNIVQLPTITGAKSFSGNLTAYAVNGTFFTGGAVSVTDTAQGNVSSATSITGAFTGSPSGTFSAAPFSPLSGSVVAISGAMNGKITGFVDTLQLTFSSNGSFTGADFAGPGSTCNVNGTLTQEGTNNVFDVTYNEGPGSCSPNTQTGIAFESKTDYFNVNGGADATYLYMILLTSTAAQVRPYVVIIYQ